MGAPAVTVAASIGVFAACFLPAWLGALHAVALTAALVTPGVVVPADPLGELAALLVAAPLLLATGAVVTLARRALDDRARRSRAIAVEHQALHRVAEAAMGGEDVFVVAARELAHVLGVDSAAIMRLEPRAGIVLGVWDSLPSPIVPGFAMPLGPGGVLAPLVERGEPVRVEAHEPDAGGLIERLGFRTLGAAPIVLDGRPWGAVVASTREDETLPPATLSRLAKLANLLALSVIDADRRRTLARDATTDPLTGLLNRRAFDELLGGHVARARATGRELALALVDLDHFKRINDRDGHLAGDRVLRDVAAGLGTVVREGDLAARLGGDEFGLVLRDAGADGAAAAVQRVRDALAARPGPAVTVSAGVCGLGRLADAQALLAAADAALYATKGAGRDGCTTSAAGG